jgi:hypothetical protein
MIIFQIINYFSISQKVINHAAFGTIMMELTPDNSHWAHSVKDLWLLSGLNLEFGTQVEDMECTESFVGFKFPPDMKELYQLVNGFKDWDSNKSTISIWPMVRIRDEYETSRDKNFVGFCDYLINSHCIGFFKGRSGIYKSYDEFNPIAPSFSEAINLINNDSDLIY